MGGGRRQDCEDYVEAALPVADRRDRRAELLHHAGAAGEKRSLQGNRRSRWLRSISIPQGRICPRQQRRVGEVRRLRAAPGAGGMVQRRQDRQLSADRVEDYHGRHHRVGHCYTCPAGKQLRQRQKIYRMPRPFVDENGMTRYRASKLDCQGCSLKPQCCPNAPARKVPRSIHEGARDMARDIANTEAYSTSRCQRKKVEMLFAHLKRILKLDRLRLRGPIGARDEFHLAATAQNLRKLAKLMPMPMPAG